MSKEYNKKYYKTKDKEKSRRRRLMFMYGITPEDYDVLYEKQQGRCAICGKHQSELKRALHIDHNHETKKVRGLLCMPCNSLLGYSYDNVEILKKAIEYLKEV